MDEKKNCNCTFSTNEDGNIVLILGCCGEEILLEKAVENNGCVECNKPIMVFDCVEDANNGE